MRKASLVSSDFVGSMAIVTSGSRKVGSVLKEDYRSHSASMLLPYVVCMYSLVGGSVSYWRRLLRTMNVSSTYERTMMKSHSFENGRSHHMQQLLQRRRTQLSLYL